MNYKKILENLIYEMLYNLDCDETLSTFYTLQEAGITKEILIDLGFEWFLEKIK